MRERRQLRLLAGASVDRQENVITGGTLSMYIYIIKLCRIG